MEIESGLAGPYWVSLLPCCIGLKFGFNCMFIFWAGFLFPVGSRAAVPTLGSGSDDPQPKQAIRSAKVAKPATVLSIATIDKHWLRLP